MKGLKQFQKFDLEEFLKGKELTFLDSNPYYEYVDGKKTENILGVKLLCVITKDDTEYDSDVTNLYEKVTIKIQGANSVNLKRGSRLKIGDGSAKVWGNFSENLTIESKNIQVLKDK
ncbi:TPA: hypothetical protein ACIGT5_001896 [Streptococcus pyogenes]